MNHWEIVKQARVLLFDLDGTLVDSDHAHEAAFIASLRRHVPEKAEQFSYNDVKGLTTRAAFRAVGVAEGATLQSLVSQKQALYRSAIEQGLVGVMPGARTLLMRLEASGRTLCLVTGGSRQSVNAALLATDLAPFFEDRITTSEDALHGKPAPDLYEAALKRYGRRRDACLGIEDSIPGIMACQRAAISGVLVNCAVPVRHESIVIVPNLLSFLDLLE